MRIFCCILPSFIPPPPAPPPLLLLQVIAADGEQKAARALKEASDVIAVSPAALQLRYLQVGHTSQSNKLKKSHNKSRKVQIFVSDFFIYLTTLS